MSRLCALLLLPSLALAPAPGGAEIIERVVAKVNGQIITLSEFQGRQIAAAQAARVDPANIGAFLRQQNAKILQDAIDEILILQKAEDSGIRAPAEWIDESIEGIRKDNKITSDEQFQDALAREGLTLAELRQNIERGVLRRIVMQRDIQPKIEATESELRAEYEKLKATQFTKPATVTLPELLVPEDAGGAAFARELAEKARAGEDFVALAKAHSAAPSRANGGDLGQLTQGEINPELEKVAFALAAVAGAGLVFAAFWNRWRVIEAFASRFCVGWVNISVFIAVPAALLYANARLALRLARREAWLVAASVPRARPSWQ